jgi:hypothetical protein
MRYGVCLRVISQRHAQVLFLREIDLSARCYLRPRRVPRESLPSRESPASVPRATLLDSMHRKRRRFLRSRFQSSARKSLEVRRSRRGNDASDVVLSTTSVCRRDPCTSERLIKYKMEVESSRWIKFQ